MSRVDPYKLTTTVGLLFQFHAHFMILQCNKSFYGV